MSSTHTIVVVPDAHVEPGQDNTTRFQALGRMVGALEAEKARLGEGRVTVIQLGDWLDMGSLSGYDRGTKAIEGKRYGADLAAGRASVEAFEHGLDGAKPRKIYLIGNHEDRISRYVSRNPELAEGDSAESAIGLHQLPQRKAGWKMVPFLEPVQIGGVLFSHYFPSGVKGRPIGGASHAKSMCQILHTSAVAGHSHLLDRHVETRPDGKRVMTLVSGCFFDHHHEWAGPANQMYWRGVTVLHDVADGSFDVEEWSMARLMRRFA